MNGQLSQKQEPVAVSYARALFDLAQERNELDSVQADLAGLTAMLYENPDLAKALSAFMFPVADRERLVEEISKKSQLHPLVAKFVQLLLTKNRLYLLASIYEAFRSLIDDSRNTVRGTAIAATPLADADLQDLAQAFSKRFNKKVVLDPRVDESLLGGIVVKVKGLTFDGSLKTTIQRLKENLERHSI